MCFTHNKVNLILYLFVLVHGSESCALSWLIAVMCTSIYGVSQSVFCSCPAVMATVVTCPNPGHLKENYSHCFGWVSIGTPIPKTKHLEGLYIF